MKTTATCIDTTQEERASEDSFANQYAGGSDECDELKTMLTRKLRRQSRFSIRNGNAIRNSNRFGGEQDETDEKDLVRRMYKARNKVCRRRTHTWLNSIISFCGKDTQPATDACANAVDAQIEEQMSDLRDYGIIL